MNFRKKISEILLLTLAVVVGGGYVYYSSLTDTGDRFSKNTTVVFNNAPVVGSKTRLENVRTKRQHKAYGNHQNTVDPLPSGTQLPSSVGYQATGSHTVGLLSGSTGYSFRAKTPDKTNLSTGGFGAGGMLAFGSGGGRSSDNGLSAQNTGGVMLSEPGATSPFAGSIRPNSVPKQNNGLILIDPMNDPLDYERIPVGDGGWVLVILAIGYVGWKKRALFL